MLGGGFIGQMHETNKQNRALLKQNKRKPFEHQEYNAGCEEILTDTKNMSPEERSSLLQEIKHNNKREIKRVLLILITATLLTAVLMYGIYAMIGEDIMAFLQ